MSEDKKNTLATDTGQGEPKSIDIKLPTGDTTSTTKKTRKSKKDKEQPIVKEADPILKANLCALIGVANKLAAVRLGKLWEFQPQEIEAIADPAARISERLGFGEAAGKYSDYYMLVLALGLPIGMRILAGKQLKQMNQEGGLHLAEPSKTGTSTGSGDDSEGKTSASDRESLENSADVFTSVLDKRLPALADTF